ncbi:MAG: metallophosphoesterase family protein, partial [Solirubrobacterales bacterium]
LGVRGVSAAALTMVGAAIVLAASSCGSKTAAQPAAVAVADVAPAKPARKARGLSKHTIVAVGDISCPAAEPVTPDLCHQAAVAKRVAKIDPASVLLLGDVQYNFGEYAEFQNSFGRSWSALRGLWRPVIGNHEYYTPGAEGYFKFFGRRAGNGRGAYYSFNVSGWHVVALNANCEYVGCGQNSLQGRWLKGDLADNPRKCTIGYWHQPLFSSGEHGSNPPVRPLWSMLQSAGADLVLNGHDHNYERFAPQDANGTLDTRRGMREFVVGTGGRSQRALKDLKPNSQFSIVDRFGVLALDLGKSGYKWRFVGENGRILDRGTGRCH